MIQIIGKITKMDKLEQLLNQYNQPYSLYDDDRHDTNMKRQKIRL